MNTGLTIIRAFFMNLLVRKKDHGHKENNSAEVQNDIREDCTESDMKESQ